MKPENLRSLARELKLLNSSGLEDFKPTTDAEHILKEEIERTIAVLQKIIASES